jgi:hypothetical protein
MWFTETPWPPVAICLVISAVFFGKWFTGRNPRNMIAAASFVALSGVIIVVESLIVTERERVGIALTDLAADFQRGDADRCAEFFSNSDRTDRDLVRRAAGMVKIDSPIRITDLAINLSSTSSRATSDFRANATASYQGHQEHGWTHWELTWQREANEWKIVRVRRLRFLGGEEIEPLSVME